MKKLTELTKLTEDQKNLIPLVRQEYLDKFYSYKEIDFHQCKEAINTIYNWSGYKEPLLIIVDSPWMAQLTINLLSLIKPTGDNIEANIKNNIGVNNIEKNIWNNIENNIGANIKNNIGVNNIWNNIWNNIENNIGANIRDNIGANIEKNIKNNIWNNIEKNIWVNIGANIRDNIGANIEKNIPNNIGNNIGNNIIGNNIWNNITKKLTLYEFSSYLNYSDLGWVAFYDYFQRIGINLGKAEIDFNQFKSFMDLGIYDCIQMENVCIVSKLPIYVKQDEQNRLHCENGASVEFKDGWKLYNWKGLVVPEHLIMNPETVTKEEIFKIDNAELRRAYQEKLGLKKYYEILSDGNNLILIDERLDNQGNIMKLWETKDNNLNKIIQIYEGICPSTGEIFTLYPTKENCKDAFEAKYSTFNNEKLWARQGDCGFIKVGFTGEHPVYET